MQVIEGLPPARLAAATAHRAAQTADSANLLPAEFSTRYQQQFYDRLWMRGLFAVAGVYIVGVVIYMLFLGFKSYQAGGIESHVAQLGPTYTNAIQMRDRYKVVKEREDLKYLALECWNRVAELLPANVTLEGFNFSGGKRLSLNGSAPEDQVQQIYDFNAALKKAKMGNEDEDLFDPLSGEAPTYQKGPGGTILWRLSLDLKRTETK